MARSKPERQVQTEIMKYIKANGGYVVKIIRANETGVHDLLACINGLFISIECKAEQFAKDPISQASPRQKHHLKLVKEAKGMAMVVATLEQFKWHVKDIIDDYDFLG